MPNFDEAFDFVNPHIVVVFGAGITGLSVAHELAERGFKVHIYEPEESPTEEYTCRVGGMAANQLARVNIEPRDYRDLQSEDGGKSDASPNPRFLQEEEFLQEEGRLTMRPAQRCFPLTHRIRFERSDTEASAWLDREDEYGTKNKDKLDEVFSRLKEAYAEYKKDQESAARRLAFTAVPPVKIVFNVRILGYTNIDDIPVYNRKRSENWAKWVIEELKKRNNNEPAKLKIPEFDTRLHPRGRGAEAPLGDQHIKQNRERSNRVEFQIVEQRLPGEHGYRFFPGSYRHLFDTMKRTPVFDKQGDLTHETAYNQLVSTSDPSFGFWDKEALIPLKVRRFTTLRDLQQTIEFFKTKAKFSDLDLLRLQTCFLKYMTSCKARRASEAEDASFWQYIGADRAKYSDAAQRFIDGAPQALVAMSAKETDARTQYNTLVQMLMMNPLEEFVPDMTLNASTSEAWLARWKEYLKRKGVQFFIGRLAGFTKRGDEFIPCIKGAKPGTDPIQEYDNTDFADFDPKYPPWAPPQNDLPGYYEKYAKAFVLAVSFDQASKHVWEAWDKVRGGAVEKAFTGPFQQLKNFDVFTKRRTDGEPPRRTPRDPNTGRRTNDGDPLRDISGIQYFMPVKYRFGRGHVYYADSPWGLTSISQLAFWRDRVKPIGKYIGQASFDIGNWHAPYPQEGGPTAWNSTRQETAEKTWEQALKAIEERYANSLVPPQSYHLDQGLKFAIRRRATDPATGIVRATTTAAFRANAIVNINEASPGQRYSIKIKLNVEDMKPFTAQVTAEAGDKPKNVVDKLKKEIEEKGSGIVAVQTADGDKILISPVVSTNHALIAITGVSEGDFGILLPKWLPFINVTGTEDENGNYLAKEKVAEALFDKIEDRHLADLIVTRRDATITLSSKAAPVRNEVDHFEVAVFNPHNQIALFGSPRLELTLELEALLLEAAIRPENGRPRAEIPDQSLDHALVIDNENPYIINVPGQWLHRPGIVTDEAGNIDICYGSPKGSLFRRWIPAGTYMATYTRLTTMEAANESARHAVNAILQRDLQEKDQLIGDLCDVWDPEDCEPPDLAPLKELDETLMREGLPHILDIFKVIEFLESLPDDASIKEALERVRTLIEDQYGLVTAAPLVGLDALEKAIGIQMDVMHAILSGGVSGRGY